MTNDTIKSAYNWLLDLKVQDHPGKVLVIANRSGWEIAEHDTMQDWITLKEFNDRLGRCTIIYQDAEDLKSAYEWLEDPRVQINPSRTLQIWDPDGWRHEDEDGVNMNTPISFQDFLTRLQECTIGITPRQITTVEH